MQPDQRQSGKKTQYDCSVTAVIPAYNEEDRVAETVRAVKKHVDTVLVIDDASSDATGEQASAAGATVLTQDTNQGYIAAIKRGFAAAETTVVVTIDADGEFPAGQIPDLVGPVCRGEADMVQGCRDRTVRPSEQFLTWLARWGGPVGDSGTGFRALRTELAQSLDLNGACICGIFSLEVLRRGGRIAEVPVQLQHSDEPRSIAWFHLRQVFYVGAALVQNVFSS
ncbi:glycosyltransferase family 2 protein [Salinibacter ruber]|uniref:glycosyltransferase family 2 protein n=1 Tax=Salinibacter ruber TaxID=146919 RepID=UPI002166C3D9|nr:glycosyltransferase family 2 protein [Salinibacter ruber]MCS4198102.1 glycosyltransferase involved in cell wall biosynthesis [Salinibacter ruber]